MKLFAILKPIVGVILFGAFGAGVYFTRDYWLPYVFPTKEPAPEETGGPAPTQAESVTLSDQAQKNLRITSQQLKVETYWKSIPVPGIIIDRPGFGDRGVIAPLTGVVTRIHRVAGDTVQPGDAVFTLKLLSESLHLTQTELFKASQDIKLAEDQRKRLATSGVAEARVIEVENQISRFQVANKAYRQELKNRGLSGEQIEAVAEGNFANEIEIKVEDWKTKNSNSTQKVEIQELKVELGQQVQAGQTLCLLSNHQLVSIEGRAFRDEMALLERAVQSGWAVEVDFDELATGSWPALPRTLPVTYIANTIDPESRTFRFLMPLDNESKIVASQVLWRFRPGQRVRLRVKTEAIPNAFILPLDAVAFEGADAYVFRQNGDNFDRKAVHVIYRDRLNAVVANDGSISPGVFIALTAAVQINRMLKTQIAPAPSGDHVHADGSVHQGKH